MLGNGVAVGHLIVDDAAALLGKTVKSLFYIVFAGISANFSL
jgi:hypothetical protein